MGHKARMVGRNLVNQQIIRWRVKFLKREVGIRQYCGLNPINNQNNCYNIQLEII